MNRPKHRPKGPHGLAGDWTDRLTYAFNKLSHNNQLPEVNPDELIAKLMVLYNLSHPDVAYDIIQDGLKKRIIIKKEKWYAYEVT